MKTLGFAAGICVAAIAAASSSEADVWECDRQGNVLVSPDTRRADKRYYDEDVFGGNTHALVTQSTRNVKSAIYQPMAEGVAGVYAADPAVAGSASTRRISSGSSSR